ncbi:hypothetical protein JTB14_024791 [Gonioctena quinquepunctata]|nr:hypothetical protein JTB14_024791 [Gonioctena quinquepunctata]
MKVDLDTTFSSAVDEEIDESTGKKDILYLKIIKDSVENKITTAQVSYAVKCATRSTKATGEMCASSTHSDRHVSGAKNETPNIDYLF